MWSHLARREEELRWAIVKERVEILGADENEGRCVSKILFGDTLFVYNFQKLFIQNRFHLTQYNVWNDEPAHA